MSPANSLIDMTGHPCRECTGGEYLERSLYDDTDGKVSCNCGDRINRYIAWSITNEGGELNTP